MMVVAYPSNRTRSACRIFRLVSIVFMYLSSLYTYLNGLEEGVQILLANCCLLARAWMRLISESTYTSTVLRILETVRIVFDLFLPIYPDAMKNAKTATFWKRRPFEGRRGSVWLHLVHGQGWSVCRLCYNPSSTPHLRSPTTGSVNRPSQIYRDHLARTVSVT